MSGQLRGSDRPRRRLYERWGKPVLDRVVSAVLLLLLLPALLLAAMVIRLDLGPGVLYRQQRIGRDGRPFTVLKFRTMHHDRRRGHDDRRRGQRRGHDRRRTHKTDRDPRHTRLGRFLRATGIDELPQLWNVLRGEMSLVGPRPELPDIVAGYAAWQHRRHTVRPGITGLWQISQRDNEGLMHHHVDTDLVYVDNVSLWTDVRLLTLTIPALLGLRIATDGTPSTPAEATSGD